MRLQMLTVLAGCLATLAGTDAAELVDSNLSPADVTERLKEARRDWETIEIEFVHFERIPAIYGPESRLKDGGRFTLSPDDCGELEVCSVDEDGRLEGKPSERYVWTPNEFQIHSSNGNIESYLYSELERDNDENPVASEAVLPEQHVAATKSTAEPDSPKEPATLCGAFVQCLLSIFEFEFDLLPLGHMIARTPKECLPLVFADDADQLAERFDLTVKETPENIFLFAHSKLAEDQQNYSQTAICIDRDTFIPIAKRTVLPNRVDHHTWVVTSLRVNGEPVEVSLSSKEQSTPE